MDRLEQRIMVLESKFNDKQYHKDALVLYKLLNNIQRISDSLSNREASDMLKFVSKVVENLAYFLDHSNDDNTIMFIKNIKNQAKNIADQADWL